MSRPRLLFLSLGGTITMLPATAGGIAPKLGAAELVALVPELAGVADIEARSLSRLPSPLLTIEKLVEVARLLEEGFATGFGGAVVILSQGKGGLGTFSPLLDSAGNSIKRQRVTSFLSEGLGLNLFASKPAISVAAITRQARHPEANSAPGKAPRGTRSPDYGKRAPAMQRPPAGCADSFPGKDATPMRAANLATLLWNTGVHLDDWSPASLPRTSPPDLPSGDRVACRSPMAACKRCATACTLSPFRRAAVLRQFPVSFAG